MRYTVRSDAQTDFRVCESAVPDGILQNVSLLINTRQGTVPGYREFGLPMEFEHLPTDVMLSVAAAEISAALERFEPRAKYADLAIETNKKNPAQYVLILEVEI